MFVFTAIIGQVNTNATLQWRPVYHFTPQKNWTNDPNGLIYFNGVYHLYNQQNPFENKWGHMSWGHATSTDLVHWKHLPVALPETIDKDTTWRFSGCAVWDKNNTSGWCKSTDCFVAIYTADQPNLKKESQFVAYSNDGGMSYTNYEHNPVIDLNKKDFRDPNVFWYEPAKKWMMVVSLPTEHKVRFYDSPDLKSWDLLSEFGPQGYISAAWECPSFIKLPVNGNTNKNKWVLFVSAAGAERGVFMQYFIGDFDGKIFKNDNPSDSVLAVDYGDCFYAAIPWNNAPDNKKIFIGWMTPGSQKTSPWTGQMSIPRDLSLKETKDGIRLMQMPTSVIRNNLTNLSDHQVIEINNLLLNNTDIALDKEHKLSGNAYWIDAVINVEPNAITGFKIAQQRDKNNKITSETTIGFDAANQQLIVDKTSAGDEKINSNKLKQVINLKNNNRTIRLTVLFDKSSLEVFVNDGEAVLTTHVFPGELADGISAFSSGGNAVVTSFKAWNLSNIVMNNNAQVSKK